MSYLRLNATKSLILLTVTIYHLSQEESSLIRVKDACSKQSSGVILLRCYCIRVLVLNSSLRPRMYLATGLAGYSNIICTIALLGNGQILAKQLMQVGFLWVRSVISFLLQWYVLSLPTLENYLCSFHPHMRENTIFSGSFKSLSGAGLPPLE